MTTIEKIIQLIKADKEIANNLFLFSEFRDDVSLWTDPPRDNNDYTNMKWLFVTKQQFFNLVGVNLLDNSIWCIDDEGDFHQDCDSLENFPYEMLNMQSSFSDNETVFEYFEKFKNYENILIRYEKWCKDNDIQLDKNKIYHNENGELFKKSFNKNDKI